MRHVDMVPEHRKPNAFRRYPRKEYVVGFYDKKNGGKFRYIHATAYYRERATLAVLKKLSRQGMENVRDYNNVHTVSW